MIELKQQILSRLSLTSLIGESVSLQKKGNFSTGLCPFHEESTPSFYVYEDHYHCYGCGEHGDAINYVRKTQGLAFMDSLRWLAEKAGVSLSSIEDEKKYADEWKKKARENQILLAAKEFFCSQFQDPFQGKFAREYLETRQLSPSLVQELGIGYAPAFSDALWKHLHSLGFKANELSACSLINQGRDRVYDFFQNRLIIPIRDEQSRIIAFTGRSLGNENPKYKNSRFEKGSYLFGLDRARTGIRQKARAIIVEGHFDALQMWNYHFNETVAVQGTALTQEHLRKLSTLTTQIFLIFDGDEAGKKAALKVLDLAFKFPEMHFKVALLPPDEDPDSVLKKQGADALEEILKQSEDLLDLAIRDRLRNAPSTGLADIITKHIAPWLQQISDPMRRAIYIQKISQQTGIPVQVLINGSNGAINLHAKKLNPSSNPVPPNQETLQLAPLEKEFISHLYFAQAHEISLADVRELISEYMELQGPWLDFARELYEVLKSGENPESKEAHFWKAGENPLVRSFLEELPSRKSAFTNHGASKPLTRLRLETRKKLLRKTLELLKQKTIAFKTQKTEDPELWGHLTHSLVRTTQELESVDALLRKSSMI